MAVLDNAARAEMWADLMRKQKNILIANSGLTKQQIRQIIDAADDFADQEAGTYNQMIPQPTRNNADTAIKAIALAYICLKRAASEGAQ